MTKTNSTNSTNSTNETTQDDNNVNKPIKLQHPYTTDAGVPVQQVNVKSITVKLMKAAQRRGGTDEAETEVCMVAFACDLVPEDIDKMQMIDYMTVRTRFQKINFNHSE